MPEVIVAIANTPIPVILIVAGVAFLLLAIADKVYGEIRVAARRRKHALGVGALLLSLGLAVQLAPVFVDKSVASDVNWRQSEGVTWVLSPNLRPSFNCSAYSKFPKSSSLPQSDLICMYPTLAAADREMADYYREYRREAAVERRPEIRKAQRDWVVERNVHCPVAWSDLETPGVSQAKARCLTDFTKSRIEFYKSKMNSLSSES